MGRAIQTYKFHNAQALYEAGLHTSDEYNNDRTRFHDRTRFLPTIDELFADVTPSPHPPIGKEVVECTRESTNTDHAWNGGDYHHYHHRKECWEWSSSSGGGGGRDELFSAGYYKGLPVVVHEVSDGQSFYIYWKTGGKSEISYGEYSRLTSLLDVRVRTSESKIHFQ